MSFRRKVRGKFVIPQIPCPKCGAPRVIFPREMEQREDGTIWIAWEELCLNKACSYDKVYGTRWYPPSQPVEFYG